MTQKNQTRRPMSRAEYIRQRRRRQQRNRILLLAGIALALIAIVVIIIVSVTAGDRQDKAVSAMQPAAELAAGAQDSEQEAAPEASAEPSPEPTAEPDPRVYGENPAYAALRPTASEGYLPIFRSIKTDEKVVAITVDDCYQADNFRKIVDLALEYNGKLTIFPIGENAIRDSQAETIRYAWENGMEIENHTYTHNGLYNCSNEELAKEMYMQNLAISHVLGVEYQCHFIRPKGGDARDDQRIHAYAKQLGYYGIAHWSNSGNASAKTLINNLAPGQIYLFHTTDKDLQILQGFIPYLVEQGYRLITMNEMFGYASNEYSELTIPIKEHVVPPLEEFEYAPRTYQNGDYAYAVKLIQDRLKKLGYLSSNGDGIYGEGTVKGVKKFQDRAGLPQTGKVDPTTLERLFASDAPRR